MRNLSLLLCALTATLVPLAPVIAQPAPRFLEIPADDLEDKIRGGMLAEIIGNLNGLPHEFKYINEPGNVEHYTPSLPDGAFTDDDTDIEWVYLREIVRSRENFIRPDRIADLWKTHINRRIFCANRYARDLMDLDIKPPWTGNAALNPWSEFNISGQFICESFGLMAPAMPQTAARLGIHFTRVAIDGEPAQATQLFTTMIAMAYIETDIEKLLDAGMAAIDPKSEIANVVTTTRKLCRDNPTDWRATRRELKARWQKQGGVIRERNGYELNTACTIAALIYGQNTSPLPRREGQGEGSSPVPGPQSPAPSALTETLRIAFNLGWDADNNAATAATIVGVMKGRRWMNQQGWTIKDVYRNTTRDNMPTDETLTTLENTLIEAARITIQRNGGQIPFPIREGQGEGSTPKPSPSGRGQGEGALNSPKAYRILIESPTNIEPLATNAHQLAHARERFLVVPGATPQPRNTQLANDLTTPGIPRRRAAYLAICLGESDKLRRDSPAAWTAAITELQEKHPAVVRDLFRAPKPQADALRQRATQAGLHDPKKFKPTERPLEE